MPSRAQFCGYLCLFFFSWVHWFWNRLYVRFSDLQFLYYMVCTKIEPRNFIFYAEAFNYSWFHSSLFLQYNSRPIFIYEAIIFWNPASDKDSCSYYLIHTALYSPFVDVSPSTYMFYTWLYCLMGCSALIPGYKMLMRYFLLLLFCF